jgi:hypothetical protein
MRHARALEGKGVATTTAITATTLPGGRALTEMEACNPRLLLDKAIGAEEPQRGVEFEHDVDTIMKYHH